MESDIDQWNISANRIALNDTGQWIMNDPRVVLNDIGKDFPSQLIPLADITFDNSTNGSLFPETRVFTSEDLWAQNETFARHMVPAMLFVALLMFIGLPGNCLVVYVYGFRFKSATQHVLIVCLACFDLVMCVVAMPSEIADIRFHHRFNSAVACKLLRFVTMYVSIASCLTLISVAYDRHRRITQPLSRQMSPQLAKRWAAINMLGALCISWPIFVMTGLKPSETLIPGLYGKDCSFSAEFADTKYPLVFNGVLAIGFFTSTAILSVLYFRIWRAAKTRKINMAKRYTITSLTDSTNSNIEIKIIDRDGKDPQRLIMRSLRKQPSIGNTAFHSQYDMVNSQTSDNDFDHGLSIPNQTRFSSVGELNVFSLPDIFEDSADDGLDTEADNENGYDNERRISVDLFMEYFSNLISSRSKPIDLPPDIEEEGDSFDDEQSTSGSRKSSSSNLRSLSVKGDFVKTRNGFSESRHKSWHQKSWHHNSRFLKKNSISSVTEESSPNSNIETGISFQSGTETRCQPDAKIPTLSNHDSKTSSISNTINTQHQNCDLHNDTDTIHTRGTCGDSYSIANEETQTDLTTTTAEAAAEAAAAIPTSSLSDTQTLYPTNSNIHNQTKDTSDDLDCDINIEQQNELSTTMTITETTIATSAIPSSTATPKTSAARRCSTTTATPCFTINEMRSMTNIELLEREPSSPSGRSQVSDTPTTYLDAPSSPGADRARRNQFLGSWDKTTVVALAVSCVFVLSFLPYLIVMSIRGLSKTYYAGLDWATLCVYQVFIRFYFLNSASNPIIYGLFNPNFRRECSSTWRRFIGCCIVKVKGTKN